MSSATDHRTVFRSSDLSRSAAEVFSAAAEHPVEVTRRDGESLVLMSERENEARNELLDLAAQLIATSTHGEDSLTERLSERFPWMLALNEEDREDCADSVLSAARASFSTHQPHLAIAELTAWRETAVALAAGWGPSPAEWLEEDEPVARP